MSSFDQLFEQIDSMIATHVAAIEDHNAQIEALKTARKALQTEAAKTSPAEKPARRRRTVKVEDDEPVIKMVTEKQLLWLERKGYDGENPEELTREEASAILDDLFNGNVEDDAEVEETPRQKRTAKATRTKRSNGNGGNGKSVKTTNGSSNDKETRKAAILRLHKDGLKPREIADELEANVSYVYLILREQRTAGK